MPQPFQMTATTEKEDAESFSLGFLLGLIVLLGQLFSTKFSSESLFI